MFEQSQEDSSIERIFLRLSRRYRQRVEGLMIYLKERWVATAVLLILYLLRVITIGGFYVVSYIFGLYTLHLIVQFLTPQGMPDIDDEDEDGELGQLPIHTTAPARTNPLECEPDSEWNQRGPLIRSMNEFKFWHKQTIAAFISLLCTLSRAFDLPVFWPFLLAYFLMLVVFTAKRQLKHMTKYNYSIFDFLKKTNK